MCNERRPTVEWGAGAADNAMHRTALAVERARATLTLFLDADFRIVWSSDAGRGFFGRPSGPGESFIDLVHADDLEAVLRSRHDETTNGAGRARRAFGGSSIDIRVKHKSGRHVIVDAAFEDLAADPDVNGVLVTLRKMSNRAYLDRAVELLSDEGDISEVLRAITSYLSEEMGAVAASVSTRIAGENIVVGTELITDSHPLVTWNEGWGPLGPGKLNEPTLQSVGELPIEVAGPALAFGASHIVSLPVLDAAAQVAGAVVVWLPYRPAHVDPPNGAGRFATRLARLAILQERARRSLLHQARHDPLTGLANRTGLDRVLDNVTPADLPLALMYCDLDEFKEINDTHGHGVGDDLLKLVAERISQATRADDVGVRIGGDEFVVVCPRITEAEMATVIVERVRARVELPWADGVDGVSPSISIGCAVAETVEEVDGLLEIADQALYVNKRNRRG